MEFPCSSCGCCCTRIHMVIDTMKDFPYGMKPDGSCEMLGDDNKCKVYETRPDCCRVDKVYDSNFKDAMTRKEFYKYNSIACNQWMKEDGVEESFRIDMKKYE